jgi:PAS domain S-box-containing protein
LKHPVSIDERVLEVAQVAQALESARVDLQNMLSVLQSEKDWTDHLLGSIVEGIITLDKGHKITFFSPGAERITGWTSEKVLGAHIDDVFGLAQSKVPFSGHIPPAGEKRILDVNMADNRQANLAITRAQLAPPTAEEALIVLVFRDVSGEQAMHRLIGQFLANIAHEFRTPLSALGAAIELLMDQAADLTESELKELLNSLHLGTLGLQNLVDNLLESASIEAGRFHISPRRNDISEIVSEAVTIMRPLLEKYGQRLTIDMPLAVPAVHAAFRRTVQVLVNLISNASKYGPPEAPIKISVIPEPGWVRVQVADCGPGIPTSKKDMVFQRFLYPQDLDDSAKSGAGLGLSVVKAIIEAPGGKVGVEDRKDGGAIFWFTLPKVNEG